MSFGDDVIGSESGAGGLSQAERLDERADNGTGDLNIVLSETMESALRNPGRLIIKSHYISMQCD